MKSGIFISQRKYAMNIMNKFEMENDRCKDTHVSIHIKLSKDEQGATIDQSFYMRMIGSLLYLTTICPNINFLIDVYAHYQANPKISHFTQVKHIIKY